MTLQSSNLFSDFHRPCYPMILSQNRQDT